MLSFTSLAGEGAAIRFEGLGSPPTKTRRRGSAQAIPWACEPFAIFVYDLYYRRGLVAIVAAPHFPSSEAQSFLRVLASQKDTSSHGSQLPTAP
jgi:hypothetical protein